VALFLAMRVLASDPAAGLIAERGARLYVWPKKARCCGGLTTLVSAHEPPPGTEFRRETGCTEFELYLPAALARVPDELHVELRRFPRRVESYWNGCAWVT
jgi:hypothetical protein